MSASVSVPASATTALLVPDDDVDDVDGDDDGLGPTEAAAAVACFNLLNNLAYNEQHKNKNKIKRDRR